jgi:hypothetical protein
MFKVWYKKKRIWKYTLEYLEPKFYITYIEEKVNISLFCVKKLDIENYHISASYLL